jgi:UDP:flavonoid glycosyltransferase YjiC (YdhE family)
MRVLLTSWAQPTHYFPMVPLGWALRAHGHEVRVASQPALADVITRSGLPAVVTGHDVDMKTIFEGLSGGAGSGGKPPWANRAQLSAGQQRVWTIKGLEIFVPILDAMIGDLLDFARQWQPDLIVFEPTTWAGPLAGAVLGVPAVRHLWGIDFTLKTREYEPEVLGPTLDRLGLAEAETLGAVTVDNCPPSLQVPGTYPRLGVRYVPYNGPGTAPDWLLDPPPRPRVCVTWGATNAHLMPDLTDTRPVLEALARMDVEVVAALSAADARRLGPPPERVRVVESLPLHLLLPTCDLIVHQGGMGTCMTAFSFGLPQLILPVLPEQRFNAHRLAASGAAITLPPWEANPDELRGRLTELLDAPEHRAAAGRVRAEMQAQPPPTEVVADLERLAKERHREPEPVS